MSGLVLFFTRGVEVMKPTLPKMPGHFDVYLISEN